MKGSLCVKVTKQTKQHKKKNKNSQAIEVETSPGVEV